DATRRGLSCEPRSGRGRWKSPGGLDSISKRGENLNSRVRSPGPAPRSKRRLRQRISAGEADLPGLIRSPQPTPRAATDSSRAWRIDRYLEATRRSDVRGGTALQSRLSTVEASN